MTLSPILKWAPFVYTQDILLTVGNCRLGLKVKAWLGPKVKAWLGLKVKAWFGQKKNTKLLNELQYYFGIPPTGLCRLKF